MRHDLGVLYRVGSLVGLTDQQVLERFQLARAAGDDAAAELALTVLVDRHSGMVWSVCRSLIGDRHDAEDSFQATFLILARKAVRLRLAGSLGPWLHVVAYRTALGVRASSSRRRRAERAAAASGREAIDPPGPFEDPDVVEARRASIHAAIMRRPEAFRMVVVLCDIEGRTYLQAAGRLGIPLGTVQSRMSRARSRLRRRLTIRGIGEPGSDESSLGTPVIGAVPPALVGPVIRLGALIASDPSSLATIVAGSIRAIVESGLRTLSVGRLTGSILLVTGALLAGGTWLQAGGSAQKGSEATRPAAGGEVRPRAVIPAPRRLAVGSGQGRTRVYLRDRDNRRIAGRRDGRNVGFQVVDRDFRWVAIIGEIDHRTVLEALTPADGKPLPPAEELYLRVDLQRQVAGEDDSWSRWQNVDQEANYTFLDDLPEMDSEWVPAMYRLDNLVDGLPHLSRGRWRGVDVEEFLPAGTDPRKERAVIPARPSGLRLARPPVLMVRVLDFTVEPGPTYRYRARIVLRNPRYDRKVQREKYLFGPWSAATRTIEVPGPRGRSASPVPLPRDIPASRRGGPGPGR